MAAIKWFTRVVLRRPNTTSSDDLLQAQTDTGARKFAITKDFHIQMTPVNAGLANRIELQTFQDANTTFAIYNPHATRFHFVAHATLFEVPGSTWTNGSVTYQPIRLRGRKPTAGAPTDGTWSAGDMIVDSNGDWHLCSVGGTPGTWV